MFSPGSTISPGLAHAAAASASLSSSALPSSSAASAAALHNELVSRLVVWLDSRAAPSPLLPFLSAAAQPDDETRALVSLLVRHGAAAELAPSLSVLAVCGALFHFLALLQPLCPPSSYDLFLLGFSLKQPQQRLSHLTDTMASLDLVFGDLVSLFGKWLAEKEEDERIGVARLLAPLLLRPRDAGAPYVAADDPAAVVAELLRVTDSVPAPKSVVSLVA